VLLTRSYNRVLYRVNVDQIWNCVLKAKKKKSTCDTRSPHTYQIYILKIVIIIIKQIPTVKHIHHTNTDISKVTLKLLLCLCVLNYSSFVYTCVCVFLHIQSPLRECRSIWSGASVLAYYCAPLVCVPAVLGLLAVCWHNKRKPVFFIHASCFLMCILFTVSFIWLHVYAFGIHSMVHCGSAVWFGRVLPGFPITVHQLYAFRL